MSKLVLHSATEQRLENLISNLPQSLLISGPSGIGLSAIATHLADRLGIVAQFILPERDEKVDLERGTITVDTIRRLYDITKTVASEPRLIIIDYAERMGVQAQNAFLKLLEEPGVNTHFILLTHSTTKLLPTILSRMQALEVRKITTQQSEKLLDDLGVKDARKRAQLIFIGDGLPASISTLASNEDLFNDRVTVVRDARQYLQGTTYERLSIAASYKEDRQKSLLLLDDAMKLLQQNIQDGKSELIPKVEQLLRAYDRITANGNIRLQLGAAMV